MDVAVVQEGLQEEEVEYNALAQYLCSEWFNTLAGVGRAPRLTVPTRLHTLGGGSSPKGN